MAKETVAQAAILDYLAARRVFAVRLNNIPATFLDAKGNRQFRRLPKHAKRGLADIIALKTGTPYFIEVKSDIGRQSPEQKEFQREVEDAGGVYIVARQIEDVQRIGL